MMGPWDDAHSQSQFTSNNSNSNSKTVATLHIQWDSASGAAFLKAVDQKVTMLSTEWDLALKPSRELVKR
jgi:hypothetical protein